MGESVDVKIENGIQPTELESKIIKQVEYYFGDLNLPRDKFLQPEIKKDHGWVSIAAMMNFNRLKNLTPEPNVVLDALDKSEFMEVSDDRTKIRRSMEHPLPDNNLEWWTGVKARTCYVKGFAEDTPLEKIEEFFRPHGEMSQISMRRTRNVEKDKPKIFKGSVFATFVNKEDADKFVALEDLKFGDSAVTKEKQSDYYKRKCEDRKSKVLQKKQEKEEVRQKVLEQAQEHMASTFTAGLVMKLTGFPKDCGVTREAIRAAFDKAEEVAWIDFKTGETEAFVRFTGDENAAQGALDKLKSKNEGKTLIATTEVEGSVLTGEDEKNFWKNVAKAKHEAMLMKQDGRDKKKRGGRNQAPRNNPPRGAKTRNQEAQNTKKVFKEDEDQNGTAEEAMEQANGSAEKRKPGEAQDSAPAAKKAKTEAESEGKIEGDAAST